MRKISPKLRTNFQTAFINHCAEAIQIGYDIMYSEKRYETDWEEDNLTICLVQTIKQAQFLGQYRISVNYQPPIYDEAMAFEGANPLRAPRVDFKFSKFFGPMERDYYAEAKNLSETDWVKPKAGTTVYASHYRARYIDTGITNYLSGRYPEGCLVGYIVNGTVANVVAGLNTLIDSRNKKLSTGIGRINNDTSTTLTICYSSDNQSVNGPFAIRHLMLQLAD